MKKVVSVFVVFFLLMLPGYMQAQQSKVQQLYQDKQYKAAVPLYRKLINQKKTSKELLFELADCYFHLKDYKNAELIFQRYINEADKFPTVVQIPDTIKIDSAKTKIEFRNSTEQHPKNAMAYFYLAEALMTNNKYEEARKYFIEYYKIHPEDKRGALYAKTCQQVKEWVTRPAKYEVYAIPQLNSKLSEFAAVEYRNGVLFVSDRLDDVLNESNDGYTQSPYLGIVYAPHKKSADSLSYGRSGEYLMKFKGDYHTGPVCFNTQFNEMVLCRVDEFKDKKISKDAIHKPQLYLSKSINGKKWGKLESFTFNNPLYSFAHPSFSPDGTELYFTSDKPGGFGGMDLWVCKRNGNGWDEPVNLGALVNTVGNESFPFADSSGVLYFSSDGHGGLGGIDIFSVTKVDSIGYSEPVNLKSKINSAYDDFAFYLKPDHKGGYFASNRAGGKGGDDIYGFYINRNLINVTGKILLSENVKDGAENVKILLLTSAGAVVQTTTTDASGHFSFDNIKSDEVYIVQVDESDPTLKSRKKLFMADQNNRLVKVTVVSDKGRFSFQNLPADLTVLDQLEEVDVTINTRLLSGYLSDNKDSSHYLSNVRISLVDESGEVVQTRITNEKGYFVFTNLLPDEKYIFLLGEESAELRALEKVNVKDKQRKIIAVIARNDKGAFAYELLKTDAAVLALMEEEDGTANKVVRAKMIDEDTRSPIPLAKVLLYNSRNELLQVKRTDGLGNFKFVNISTTQSLALKTVDEDPALAKVQRLVITDQGGKVLYRAEHKGKSFEFALLQTDNAFVNLIAEEDNTVLKKSIRGLLTSGDKTQLIAGAKVLLKDGKGHVVGMAFTNASGKFTFNNLSPDDSYALALEAEDPALKTYNKVVLRDLGGKEILVSEKSTNGTFDFALLNEDKSFARLMELEEVEVTKRLLSGKLMAGDGSMAEIAGAKISLKDPQLGVLKSVTSDAKGRFHFDKVDPERTYSLVLDESDPALKNYLSVVIVDSKGKELYRAEKQAGGFDFAILPFDQISMQIQEDEDVIVNYKEMVGVMIAGDGDNNPIANAGVHLLNSKNEVVGYTKTNENGRFRFVKLKQDESYMMQIDESDPSIKKYNNIFITDKNGKLVCASRKSKNGFVFQLINPDENGLALLEEEEPTIMKDMKGFLFQEGNQNLPVANAVVLLRDKNGNVVKQTVTGKNGYFRFAALHPDEQYILSLTEDDPALKSTSRKLVIKDMAGNTVLTSEANSAYEFNFNLINSDNAILSLMEEEDTRIKVDFKGKILSENKLPVKGVKVLLKGEGGAVIRECETNEDGNFVFRRLMGDQNYLAELDENDPALKKYKALYLADEKGSTVKKVFMGKDGVFKFELLKQDQYALASINQEDVLITFKKGKSKVTNAVSTAELGIRSDSPTQQQQGSPASNVKTKLVKEETCQGNTGDTLVKVFFTTAKFDLSPKLKKQLDKVAKIMLADTTVLIAVNGYADSRGNAAFNLKLSEKRRQVVVDYLLAKGVPVSRIEGAGYGENNLVNNCSDEVKCTEAQHAVNRRTEVLSKSDFNVTIKK